MFIRLALILILLIAQACRRPIDYGPDNPGGLATVSATGESAFSLPAANIDPRWIVKFARGNRSFKTPWSVQAGAEQPGLGPLFNHTSCAGCHPRDGRGQPPKNPGDLDHGMLIQLGDSGKNHPLYGDTLQTRAIQGHNPEPSFRIRYEEIKGEYADHTPYSLRKPIVEFNVQSETIPAFSARTAPALIGLGLLESISESEILIRSQRVKDVNPAIGGRMNHVRNGDGDEIPGRFGWKASVARIEDQIARAAFRDMGVSSRLLPASLDSATAGNASEPEMKDDVLANITFYIRSIGVPARRDPWNPDVQRGEEVFLRLGCANCHAETFVIGRTSLDHLTYQVIHPYTDLLLHEMGPGLADHRSDGEATGSEWRTAPLWGIGLVQTVNGHEFFLHDGRARGFEEAILWHGGQAEASRNGFLSLAARDRALLLQFLRSL